MIVVTGEGLPANMRGGVVAIGNFDGVHRGHQMLLAHAQGLARAQGKPFGVITFEPHPRTLFRPDEPVFRLTPAPLKAALLKVLGADFLLNLTFDTALAAMPPEAFVAGHLVARAGISHIVSGYDFHFGHKRHGTPETLRALGGTCGFSAEVIDQVSDDDGIAPFSSSSIRDCLRHGNLSGAARQLGWHWMIEGPVVQGDQRGRTIGFPTVNIAVEPGTEPLQGIYAVRVMALDGTRERWKGAGYFGRRPTFDTPRTFLEVYLLDYSGDLYGRPLRVEFVSLIRPDRIFASVEDLVARMKIDCAEVRVLLDAKDPGDDVAGFPLGRWQAAETTA